MKPILTPAAAWTAAVALAASAAAHAGLEWHFEHSGGVPDKLVWQTEVGRIYDLYHAGGLSGWTRVDGFPKPGAGAAMEHAFTAGARGFFRIAVGAAMVPVAAGEFLMGDQADPPDGFADELPVHAVTVSAFQIQSTEVSNDEMVEVLNWAHGQGRLVVTTATVENAHGDQQELLDLDASQCRIRWNPDAARFEIKEAKGAGYPCLEVTWHGAAAWCNWRSEMDNLTPCYSLDDWSCAFGADGYRLPTEAEWEKAARGGLTGRFPFGDIINHGLANYFSGNQDYEVPANQGYHPAYATGGYPYTAPVDSLPPTGPGLHHMTGNVAEWCWDWYAGDSYASPPASDPRGPATGSERILRGGDWAKGAEFCRVACRDYRAPDYSGYTGFRPVRAPAP